MMQLTTLWDLTRCSKATLAVGQQVFQLTHIELQLVNILPNLVSLWLARKLLVKQVFLIDPMRLCYVYGVEWYPSFQRSKMNGQKSMCWAMPAEQFKTTSDIKAVPSTKCTLITHVLSMSVSHLHPLLNQKGLQPPTTPRVVSPLPWCRGRYQVPRRQWAWSFQSSDEHVTTSCQSPWRHWITWVEGVECQVEWSWVKLSENDRTF